MPQVATSDSLGSIYAPAHSDAVLYAATEVATLRDWLRDAQPGALGVATAPCGSGLTTLVRLLLHEADCEPVWIGAGTPKLRILCVDAGGSPVAINGKRKIIVMDEFEALMATQTSQTEVSAVLRKELPTPIICCGHATRTIMSRMAELLPRAKYAARVTAVTFSALSTDAVCRRVSFIAESEGIDEQVAASACEAARGDLRAAIAALSSKLHNACKDFADDGLATVVRVLGPLQRRPDVRESLVLFDRDPGVAMGGCYENYPRACPNDSMSELAEVAECYSVADVLEAQAGVTRWDEIRYHIGALCLAGPSVLLPANGKVEMSVEGLKYGTLWSKVHNRAAKLKLNVGVVRRQRAEAGLSSLDAEALGLWRRCVHTAAARKDGTEVARLCHGMDAAGVLAAMRLFSDGAAYSLTTHGKVKKWLAV